MTDAETAAKTDPYAAWRFGGFRLYALSWLLIAGSKAIETVAVSVDIYNRTGDCLMLGLIGLANALPFILLSIIGGQIADKYNRKKVLSITLFLSVLASVGLLANSLHTGNVWITYLFVVLGAISMAIGGPSRTAIIPQVVPLSMLGNALTWSTTMFHIASMVGPAVGGVLLNADKTASLLFAVVFVTRIFAFLAVLFMKPGEQTIEKETVSLKSLVAGIRFVGQTKLILATITLDLFAVLFGGLTLLLPVFAKDILQVGESGTGFLRAAEAIGAVFMAMILARMPLNNRTGWKLFAAVAGFGICTILFGVSSSFWLSMGMMFLIGAFDNISVVIRHTLVQMLTPDHMRGRVSAVNTIFIVTSNDIGGFESGLTAWLLGPVASVVLGGIGTIVTVVACAIKWPEILALKSLNDLRPLDKAEVDLAADEEALEKG